jgi:hypothetical protein
MPTSSEERAYRKKIDCTNEEIDKLHQKRIDSNLKGVHPEEIKKLTDKIKGLINDQKLLSEKYEQRKSRTA